VIKLRKSSYNVYNSINNCCEHALKVLWIG
jgi:hypothetical protein